MDFSYNKLPEWWNGFSPIIINLSDEVFRAKLFEKIRFLDKEKEWFKVPRGSNVELEIRGSKGTQILDLTIGIIKSSILNLNISKININCEKAPEVITLENKFETNQLSNFISGGVKSNFVSRHLSPKFESRIC